MADAEGRGGDADRGASDGPLDTVAVQGIRVRGTHGVLRVRERSRGRTFVVDVVLHLDTRAAAASDDLAAAVDYGTVAASVARVVAGERHDLIETVAQRVADTCLVDARVRLVDVAVHKPQAPLDVAFDDVVVRIRRGRIRAVTSPVRVLDLDAVPRLPVPVVLALGSNLGDRAATLRAAVTELRRGRSAEVRASPVVETDPVGGPEQGDYLNAVVLGRSGSSPRELLRRCRLVEAAHGRQRTERWGPRTLDVDVVAVGDLVASDARPEPAPSPRARAGVRARAVGGARPGRGACRGRPVGGSPPWPPRPPTPAGVRPRPDLDLAHPR